MGKPPNKLKGIIYNIKKPKNQRTKTKKTRQKGGEPGGPVVGKPLCTVLLVWAWLIACFFIRLYGSYCVEGLCVAWLLPVGTGGRKIV